MSTAKIPIKIPNAPAPVGPYSQAILIDRQLYVSGQIPLNPQTGQLETTTIEQATTRVLQNIEALLKEAGFSKDDVVKVSIFMKNLEEFQAMNTIYANFFSGVAPARETVQVSRLPLDVNIEISCIAYK
ncbi:MAG: Rid family detoxifying hydrolase [Cryomorphaceae bacterium]|jgi:2-iminobutanoate/2-iminopropanoate deaminase|nr:Rid family detoxifying hydrolase [Cryomorphaceae bacterium]